MPDDGKDLVDTKETFVTELDWVFPQPPTPEDYANHVSIGMSLWDITLHFGSIVGVNQATNHLQVTKRISMHLSPEAAMALSLSLNSALEKYQERFGKLRFPPPSGTVPVPFG